MNVPDVPQTFLAFRVWRIDKLGNLLSLNAPGKASSPATAPPATRIQNWLASPSSGWPAGEPLKAECRMVLKGDEEGHGRVPVPDCSCGIYATTDLKVINSYLGKDAPVLGVVELGGKVIPATQGYRAEYARIAAILLIEPVFTLPHSWLEFIAETYEVPALVPHSVNPEDYRAKLARGKSIGDEADEWLRKLQEGDDNE